ncbi:MAG: aspartate-semialdehyde dehydrogenase [Bacteroidia bacterium]|nr:aspartate-semialdehyde dehydrogenase [Bacteroidia bacterium]
MKVAVIGATGLVGGKMLQVLEERKFPVSQLIPVASDKSIGKKIKFNHHDYPVISIEEAIEKTPQVALFSAGGNVSLKYAEKFAEKGTVVIDNSSAWRMHEGIKLVVPEINGDILNAQDKIIANPNCSTIQMVMALYPLHCRYKIKRIVVSTYQSVTGTGALAVSQLMDERKGKKPEKSAYPYAIDLNVIPQIDIFMPNSYTKEEMKMVNETRKIMNAPEIKITATTVRIPVIGGHSESVNVEFEQAFEVEKVKEILSESPGVIVQDDINNLVYPMPKNAHESDEVYVGRIRRDESIENGLNLWIVSDNLRKGAATNTVQIAELLLKNNLLKA